MSSDRRKTREMIECRREVMSVLGRHSTHSTHAPLVVGDLKRVSGPTAPPLNVDATKGMNAKKVVAGDENDVYAALDRELDILVDRNTGLESSVKQPRAPAVSSRPLSPRLDVAAAMRLTGALTARTQKIEEQVEALARSQQSERRTRHENRRLAEALEYLRYRNYGMERQNGEARRLVVEKNLRSARRREARRHQERNRMGDTSALYEEQTKREEEARAQVSPLSRQSDCPRAEPRAPAQDECASAREAPLRMLAPAAEFATEREREARLACGAKVEAFAQESETMRQRRNERSHRAWGDQIERERERERERRRRRRSECDREIMSRRAVMAETEAAETRRRRAAKERTPRQTATSATIERERDAGPIPQSMYELHSPAAELHSRTKTNCTANTPTSTVFVRAYPSTIPDGCSHQDRRASTSTSFQATEARRHSGSDMRHFFAATSSREPRVTVRRRGHNAADGHDSAVPPIRRASSSSSTPSERRCRRLNSSSGKEITTQEQSLRPTEERMVYLKQTEETEGAAYPAGEREGKPSRETDVLGRRPAQVTARLKAGAAIATGLLEHAKRTAVNRAFMGLTRMCREARESRILREAALRNIVKGADGRSKTVQIRALRQWRFAAAKAAMYALRQRQRKASIVRAVGVAEAVLRRRRRLRLAGGFRHWKSVDAEALVAASAARARRAHAVKMIAALLQRRRRACLRQAFGALDAAVREAAERTATKNRKLAAARAVRLLLVSAGRAFRRNGFLRWRGVVLEAAATSRLQDAWRVALERCARRQQSRGLRVAWEIIRARVHHSRELATAVGRIEGTLLRARQRSLSRRVGLWRSEAFAGAIVKSHVQYRTVHHYALRLLADVVVRFERRQKVSGWRALTLFAAKQNRARVQRDLGMERAVVMVRTVLNGVRRRQLVGGWMVWKEMVSERRLLGAVGATKESLEGEKAVLAAQVQRLERREALRLISSIMDRFNRTSVQRGWNNLRHATQRRAILLRAKWVLHRSRLQVLRRALHRWQIRATEFRAAHARAQAGLSVLAACLAGVRTRNVRPAWTTWLDLVAREREEEDEFADHGEGLLRFAASLSRVGLRRDWARKRRALCVWRLGAAQSAVFSAQQEAAATGDMARVVEGEKVVLLAALPDFHQAGGRLLLRWLRRRQLTRQRAAWRKWRLTISEGKIAEERVDWRMRMSTQLARELARVVENRRRRILRRSVGMWHRHAQVLSAYCAILAEGDKLKKAGARRLSVILEHSVLRQKAKVWARLVSSAAATSERVARERDATVQRNRLVVSVKVRAERRFLAGTFLAWKGAWLEGRHRAEVNALRVRQGGAAIAAMIRRKEREALRQAVVLWRARGREARERERAMWRIIGCFQRADARFQRASAVRRLIQWRMVCVVHRKVVAEKSKASTEMAFRGQAVVTILRRKRLHRLGEAFRRWFHHKTVTIYGTRVEEARRAGLARGLRGLERVVARERRRHVVSAFARWRCFAAEMGQQSDRALLVSARRRAGAQNIGSILSRRDLGMLSRAWTAWRSGAASAAVHDGERACADLRVSSARHSAGARLLLMTLGAARRRALMKAWRVWCKEAKEAADLELKTMEMHFHLARTLIRVEKRVNLARLGRAWRLWGKHVRERACLARGLGGVRKAQMARALRRWRLTCYRQKQAEADARRMSAEAALRTKAIAVFIKRYRARQLKEAFNRLFDFGAWAIYNAKEEEARQDRIAQGFRVLSRTYARRRERRKLAALVRWQRFVAESRRLDDRAALRAASTRAGAKALAALVSRLENACLVRSLGIWRTGAASAAVYEGERASADERVFNARRSAGVRVLLGVLTTTRRRVLTKAWMMWRKEVKAIADAELQRMEKHFHIARTLTRVERRAQLAKVDRAWRAWRGFVRSEGEAELRALEKHFHVAQVVSRVTRRAQMRRLSRAWSLWTRLAARGMPRKVGSLSALPPGLLAAARSAHVPKRSLVAAMETNSSAVVTAKMEEDEQAEHSSRVRHRAGAVSIRGLLRRADARSLARGWQAWRGVTVADASRDARFVLGATRLTTIFGEIAEAHEFKCVDRSWRKWMDWSTAEGTRLEQAADDASWATAEAEGRQTQAARARRALAVVISRHEAHVLRHHFAKWMRESHVGKPDRIVGTQATRHSFAEEQEKQMRTDDETASSETVGRKRASSASPSSGLSALRRKLLGEVLPVSPVPLHPPLDVRRSPAAVPRSSQVSPHYLSPLQRLLDDRSRQEAALLVGGYDAPKHVARQASSPVSKGTAWWGGDSSGDSSSLLSPSSRLHSVSGEIAATPNQNGRVSFEKVLDGTPRGSAHFDEAGSLDLSASPEQPFANFLGSHFPGELVPLPTTGLLTATTHAGLSVITAPATGLVTVSDSPAASVAYTSESPLLGESVLQSRSDITAMGRDEDDDGERAFVGRGLAREWSWMDDDDDNNGILDHDGVPCSPHAHGEDARIIVGSPPAFTSTRIETPKQRCTATKRVSMSSGSSMSALGNRGSDSPQQRSPPYVPGSVQASPAQKRTSLALRDEDSHGEANTGDAHNNDSEESIFGAMGYAQQSADGGSGTDEEWSGASSDEMSMSSAEIFVKRIRVFVIRRVFNRWVRAHRNAAYDLTMMSARKKLLFLRRQQKLRKVVVKALTRQSYALHANDTSRAMRKWKEFVRRRREDDRLSLEVSRISVASALSPLTPRGARAHTAGLRNFYVTSGQGEGSSEGGNSGDADTRSFHSLPFSPPITVSTRRRLWDQND